jgi:23S rRNA (adenine2503-C2)-methyltransferase
MSQKGQLINFQATLSSASLSTWALLQKLYFAVFLFSRSATGLTLAAGERIKSRAATTASQNIDLQPDKKQSIFNLPQVELWASERGLQEHHLKTIYNVVMHASTADFDLEESLIQAEFPQRQATILANEFTVNTSQLVESHPSSGGLKMVIRTGSGMLIETVLIRHDRNEETRYTVCVSSQVGCTKACSFCATGTMGLQAQLSSAEILEQVWIARNLVRDIDDTTDTNKVNSKQQTNNKLRNVVFMGMGEPLDNYNAVHEACRGLTHQCLFGFKGKQVTLSTVGASPTLIRRLADEAPQISLALSLHGATQPLREALIPAAKRAHLEDLASALDYHANLTGRGAMLEYLLIDGINDNEEAACALVKFCLDRCTPHNEKKGIRPFVNLIPYNPTLAGGLLGYQTPADERVEAFHNALRAEGINALVRWTSASGRDANGACGQLALNVGDREH